jgi:leucyl-tRNA synthetase
MEQLARGSAKVQESLSGKRVRKVVVIPNKIVNLVTG